MPDLKLSCGLDMVHGLDFHSMLVTELPLFLREHFSVDLTSQVIAGAKEGLMPQCMRLLMGPRHMNR